MNSETLSDLSETWIFVPGAKNNFKKCNLSLSSVKIDLIYCWDNGMGPGTKFSCKAQPILSFED